jgi:hypothetical protein
MSTDFVRYFPEIETIDSQIDELLAQIIDFWEKVANRRNGGHRTGVPGAHAGA